MTLRIKGASLKPIEKRTNQYLINYNNKRIPFSSIRDILMVHLSILLRRHGKFAFLYKLKSITSILDIGCGNNSPYYSKIVNASFHYTGIDITDYNQKYPLLADNYIITTPEQFVSSITNIDKQFDATISAHNLEHCDDREGALNALMNSVKTGGYLYMAFPCAASVFFPHRGGTLNYYDDSTHKFAPPNFHEIINRLRNKNFQIIFSSERYSPALLKIIGFLLEPLSYITGKVQRGTWELYGFEAIIWARRMP